MCLYHSLTRHVPTASVLRCCPSLHLSSRGLTPNASMRGCNVAVQRPLGVPVPAREKRQNWSVQTRQKASQRCGSNSCSRRLRRVREQRVHRFLQCPHRVVNPAHQQQRNRRPAWVYRVACQVSRAVLQIWLLSPLRRNGSPRAANRAECGDGGGRYLSDDSGVRIIGISCCNIEVLQYSYFSCRAWRRRSCANFLMTYIVSHRHRSFICRLLYQLQGEAAARSSGSRTVVAGFAR